MPSIKCSQWWRGAVIYQIYPRSFCDSTGNGVGDLVGIINKLPYVANLGVDAIWISPFFTSPMKDFGYDVSNYKEIDSLFGSLADFKQLIHVAHSLNIKVIIDQVLSHTSDQHAWFESSRIGKNEHKSDWYVWAEPKEDGTVPNNWLSFFGGSAWTFDGKREQYYLHNFLSSQPDLNYHNENVQDAIIGVLTFWLELGVDGFRLDTVNMYYCDAELRDNPPRSRDKGIQGMNSSNPRAYQSQLYNVNRPENTVFIEKIRVLLDQYEDRTTLGEIGSVEDTIGMMAEYTSGTERLHMCYTADLLGEKKSAAFVRNVVETTSDNLGSGWPCWSLGNHDSMRFVSRWGEDVADKLAFSKAMLVTLRGSICVYQGEELGLPEVDLTFEQLVDPFGIAFWPDYKGRDGCRTPMVWDHNSNAGFSSKSDTWLPIPKNHKLLVPSEQEQDKNSILNYFKDFLTVRKSLPALVSGDIEFITLHDDVLSFNRTNDQEKCFVAINMSEKEVEINLSYKMHIYNECYERVLHDETSLALKAWQVILGTI